MTLYAPHLIYLMMPIRLQS